VKDGVMHVQADEMPQSVDEIISVARVLDYLARGGLGFFLGDGRLNYRTEQIFETYYSMKAAKNVWFTLDYQHVQNPAYNADRGPANFFGLRLHLEM